MKRTLTLPEGKELCDFLNEEGIAPCDFFPECSKEKATEIKGFVMALEIHPGDKMLNAYQMFRKRGNKVDDDPSALWESDTWI